MQLAERPSLELRNARSVARDVASFPEVMFEDADCSVASLYTDIQQTLQVPFVNLLFRKLAAQPDVLVPAWHTIRSGLRFQPFTDAAEDLQAHAQLELTQGTFQPTTWNDWPEGERLRRFTVAIANVLPKLLLIATAWRMGRFVPSPKATTGALLQLGPDPSAPSLPMLDPDDPALDENVARVFEQIRRRHGHDTVASYFRALGAWPTFLQAAWNHLEPHVDSQAWSSQRAQLTSRAQKHVERLFEPYDGNALFGDRETALLETFCTRFIPDVMLDVYVLRAWLDGTAV